MQGTVELFSIENGVWSPLASFRNKILNSGYDAMAKALGGDRDFVVNGLYLEFYNGTPTEPTIPDDRTPEYYQNLVDPAGYLRFQTIFQPVYTSSDEGRYAHNIITIVGESSGVSAGGAALVDGTSQIFTVALACIPNYDDASRDTLVSCATVKDSGGNFNPVVKVANSQLGFRWSLKLGE